MDIAQLAITTAVALIGLYLVHSFRRQQRLKIAEQRVDAYRKLWAQMLVARPTRLDPSERQSPLRRAEAVALYGEMTNWYFEAGNGMMLPNDTKEMYLEAKQRLGEYAVGIDEGADAGVRRMRELSLLRSQMKSDLAIYGRFYFETLDLSDKAFLRTSGIRPWRWGRPWYKAIGSLRWPRRATGPDAAGNLDVSFRKTGLGDTPDPINCKASADAIALYACQNNDRNFRGDQKKQQESARVEANASFKPKNGSVDGVVMLSPPPSTLYCPGGQHAILASITYTNVQISDTDHDVYRDIRGTFFRTFFEVSNP